MVARETSRSLLCRVTSQLSLITSRIRGGTHQIELGADDNNGDVLDSVRLVIGMRQEAMRKIPCRCPG